MGEPRRAGREGVRGHGDTPRVVLVSARALELDPGRVELLEQLVVVSDEVADLRPPLVEGAAQNSDRVRMRGFRRGGVVQLVYSSQRE